MIIYIYMIVYRYYINSIFLLIKSQPVLVDVYNPSFCDAFPMFCYSHLDSFMNGLMNP